MVSETRTMTLYLESTSEPSWLVEATQLLYLRGQATLASLRSQTNRTKMEVGSVLCVFLCTWCVCMHVLWESSQLVAVYYISSLPFMESHRSIQLGLLIKRNELHPQDVNIMPRLKTMSSLLIIKTKGTAN